MVIAGSRGYQPAMALCLVLLMLAANFVFALGSYKPLMAALIAVLITHFVLAGDQRRDWRLPRSMLVMASGLALMLLVSLLPIEGFVVKNRLLLNLCFTLVISASVYWLCLGSSAALRAGLHWGLCVLLGSGLIVHVLAVEVSGRPFGLFENPHFLALLSLFSLPLFLYSLLGTRSLAIRLALAGLCLLAGYLLAFSGSRPAWLALLAAVVLASLVYLSWWRALVAIAGFLLGAVLVSLLFPQALGGHALSLAAEVWQEERLTIWRDSVRMLSDNDWYHWLTGHGIGSFKPYFLDYSTFEVTFVFPHNFVIEILFDSGLIGVASIGILYVLLFRLILAQRGTMPAAGYVLSGMVFVLLVAHLLFTFLTLPFYSRYVLLLQAPLVGLILFLHEHPEHFARS